MLLFYNNFEEMADSTMDDAEDRSEEISHHLKMTSHRRNNKPVMEKRRRARINSSLGQLKALVLQAMHKDTSQFTKLEKADILELTVKHMKYVQHQSLKDNDGILARYHAGFHQCISEVMRYLNGVNNINHELRSHICNHLGVCLQNSLNHQRHINVDKNMMTSSSGKVITILGDSIPSKIPGLTPLDETVASVTGGWISSTMMTKESMFPHIASNRLYVADTSPQDITTSASQKMKATTGNVHTSDNERTVNLSHRTTTLRQLLPNVHSSSEKTIKVLSPSPQTKLGNATVSSDMPSSSISLPRMVNTGQQCATISTGLTFPISQTTATRETNINDCKNNVIRHTSTLVNRDITVSPLGNAATAIRECCDTPHQSKSTISNTSDVTKQPIPIQNFHASSNPSIICEKSHQSKNTISNTSDATKQPMPIQNVHASSYPSIICDASHQSKSTISNTSDATKHPMVIQNLHASSYPSIISGEPVQLISGMLPAGQLAFFVVSPMSMQSPIQAIPIYTSTHAEANEQSGHSSFGMCNPSSLNSVDIGENSFVIPENGPSNEQLTGQGYDCFHSPHSRPTETVLTTENICKVGATNTPDNEVNVEQNCNVKSCHDGGTGERIFRPW